MYIFLFLVGKPVPPAAHPHSIRRLSIHIISSFSFGFQSLYKTVVLIHSHTHIHTYTDTHNQININTAGAGGKEEELGGGVGGKGEHQMGGTGRVK